MTELATAPLEAARHAMAAHAWEEARAQFLAAEEASALEPADLELLGAAQFWTGHPEDELDALERAYAQYVRADQKASAASVALRLFEASVRRVAIPVAMGWLGRAERLLAEAPPSAVNAWSAMTRAFGRMIAGDAQGAVAEADTAIELARKYGDRDAEAMALNVKGHSLVKTGAAEEGLALVDESTSAAVAGELAPWATANVYCGTMGVCRALSDWERAGTWTEVADREMRRQHINGYPGVCRVHRAEVKRVRGDWPGAEEEARTACEELGRFNMLLDVGWANYELGEVRRQMGDYAGAEAAYLKAHEYGRDPEPGLALLRLATGDQAGASSAIRRSLQVTEEPIQHTGDDPGEPLGRSHLLPAQVRIAIAEQDLETAEGAAAELETIAAQYGSTAIRASAASARGAVLLAKGDIPLATDALVRGRHLWQVVGAPYEVAKVREDLAAAYRSAGQDTDALMELEAARSTYERLGAAPDLRKIEVVLQRQPSAGGAADGTRVTKTFMFTDIVTSTDLLEALGDQAWENLIGWHDVTLRQLFAKHRGEEVSHTGDGFFVAFDDPRSALDAAVDIHRTFATHRREHGFAPWLRIGLHTAEVTRVADNYRGMGVHVAARVSALGDRDEIIASTSTWEAADTTPYQASEPRSAELKGIKGPVEVVTVGWS
jgi:class 3 adenylate cyclase